MTHPDAAPRLFVRTPFAWWEAVLVLAAAGASLALGLAHLDVPSLWHDELVHIYTAKNIAEHGWPALPSGTFYPNYFFYHLLLAASEACFGINPWAVRVPSVVLAAAAVLVLYLLTRVLAGRTPALTAAYLFALSPWTVGWSREARFYVLQALLYLLFLACVWSAMHAPSLGARWRAGLLAAAVYVLGVLTSFHSLLFLAGPGAFALAEALRARRWRSRWTGLLLGGAALGGLTLLALWMNPNKTDRTAVFVNSMAPLEADAQRAYWDYYFRWLYDNLSLGYLLLLPLGTLALAWRNGQRGWFLVLAFWAPLLLLSFAIAYRRPRFMFFAFPVYNILLAEGLAAMVQALFLFRRGRRFLPIALVAALFLARLAYSSVLLIGDSLDAASGAHTTLARRHPQWEQPCRYVREHRMDEAVLTTTFLPVYHYVGHVDDWFPNRATWWESQESGLPGLGSIEELQAFIACHPKGYFLAEHWRFEDQTFRLDTDTWDPLGPEIAWVRANMRRIDDASSEDVTLFAWGMDT